MSQAPVPLQHPLERCAAAVAAAVDDAAGSSPTFLGTSAKAEVLTALSRQIARLEGMRLAVLAVADDVAEEAAACSAGLWLAHTARLERPEGRRLQRLAEALDRQYGELGEALLSGAISRPQADVIAASLDALPADVDHQTRVLAERHLVECAAEFGPRELRVLGRRVLDVIAPEVAEEHERRALDRAERQAHQRMRVESARRWRWPGADHC